MNGFVGVRGFRLVIVVFRVRYPFAATGTMIAIVSGDIDAAPAEVAGSEIVVLFHGDLRFGVDRRSSPARLTFPICLRQRFAPERWGEDNGSWILCLEAVRGFGSVDIYRLGSIVSRVRYPRPVSIGESPPKT